MAHHSLSRSEVRAVDERAVCEFGMTGLVLMENAGRGAAECLIGLGVQGSVVICCGKGNNGGDGFVMARHLESSGVDVRVLLLANPSELAGDAAANWRILELAGTPRRVLGQQVDPAEITHECSQADWVVDALLGTGTVGAIREPYCSAIAAINRSGRRVFAVDLPSGLDCDLGTPISVDQHGVDQCVIATHTVTFVALKRGFENPVSRQFTGAITVVGIGIPQMLMAAVLIRSAVS